MSTYTKDPDEVLDYQFNWATWLGTDTISTSTVTVEPGITKDSDSNTTTAATVWLSGGTAGANYTITNEITTAGGRTKEATILIKVRSNQ